MTITINWEHGKNPVLNHMRDYATTIGLTTQVRYNQLTIHVVDFNQFLTCFWRGLSDASRLAYDGTLDKKYEVVLVLSSGRVYHTKVWYDKELKGVHYVSLYYNN